MDVVEDRGAPGKQGRGMVVNGLSEHTVTSSSDVLKLIRRAVERRQVQETNMNKTSSRSHCVFTLGVTSKSPTAEGDGMVESSGAPWAMIRCAYLLPMPSSSPPFASLATRAQLRESAAAGKLHLVDLAGSECAKAAGSSSASLERERKNINQSLLTLGRVISTLRSNSRERVPCSQLVPRAC